MSNVDSKEELRVSFEYPGGAGLICIQVNRVIATKENSREYSIPAELELLLSAVPGVIFDSVWTRSDKYSIYTEIASAFESDELLLNIAYTLGEYFGVGEDVQIGTVTDRRPFARSILV